MFVMCYVRVQHCTNMHNFCGFSMVIIGVVVLFSPRANNLSSSLMENCKPTEDRTAAVPALQQLIQEFYAPYTRRIAISVHGSERCAIWRIRDFVHELLLQVVNLKYTIEDGRANERSRRKFDNRQYSVIIVDGLDALKYLDPASRTRNYDVQEYYLVQLLSTCGTDFQSNTTILRDILQYFWKNYIINVGLLIETSNHSSELFTYFPFASNEQCKQATLRRINRFVNNHWQKTTLESVFPIKIGNLNKCALKVAVFDTPPYLSIHFDEFGLISVTDFEGELLLELSKKLNFTMDFIIPPNDEQRGRVLPNGSTTGALKLLQQRQADLSLGSFRYTLERMELLTGALPYYQTWQIYGVLRTSQSYSSLEILTFAFDITTWYCLCCTAQLVIWITFLLQHKHDDSHLARIILGVPMPQTPFLNIFAIFLGTPLASVPRNTFTRYVIMLWFIFGTTLRIAYQSLLYKLLQTNLYHRLPQTLIDLIDQDYELVMTVGTNDSVYTVPRIQARQIQLILNNNSSELSTFAFIEARKEKLFAGVSPKDFLTYYMMLENKRGLFYALPEKIFTQHITMYFSKHSYLIYRFNELFMYLRSQGLIDYWARQRLDENYFQDEQNSEARAITLNRLSGVFLIHMILLIAAFCIFCLELAWWRYKYIRRNLRRNHKRAERKRHHKSHQ